MDLKLSTVIALIIVGLFPALSLYVWETGSTETYTEEYTIEIAYHYVRNCPTFKFDGLGETLEHIETLYPDVIDSYTWQFVFTFNSRHSGYGDRTGQHLLEVITSHTAHVIVQDNRVISANLDGKWDMIKQEMIP
jgi:hypothetical protein